MTWRGSNTWISRLISCLIYALPMSSAVFYGFFFLKQFPFLVYGYIPFVLLAGFLDFEIIPEIPLGFIVFIFLYIFVVRNFRVPHFVRFNVMQAILLGFILGIISTLIKLSAQAIPSNLLTSGMFLVEIFANTIFFGMTAACGYSLVQTIRGRYAEIPLVSQASYYQAR
jgi:Chloroplast import apparatus Tic20-like